MTDNITCGCGNPKAYTEPACQRCVLAAGLEALSRLPGGARVKVKAGEVKSACQGCVRLERELAVSKFETNDARRTIRELLADTWYDPDVELPPVGMYVLVIVTGQSWKARPATATVFYDVATCVPCLEGATNLRPYRWETFGPQMYFGQNVKAWARIPTGAGNGAAG